MNYEEAGRNLDQQRQRFEDSDWRSESPKQLAAQRKLEENRAQSKKTLSPLRTIDHATQAQHEQINGGDVPEVKL